MKLTEFYDVLKAHDWYYYMSDNHATYMWAEKRTKELQAIASTSPEHQSLYDAWKEHMFSGPGWACGALPERTPMPQRPTE